MTALKTANGVEIRVEHSNVGELLKRVAPELVGTERAVVQLNHRGDYEVGITCSPGRQDHFMKVAEGHKTRLCATP